MFVIFLINVKFLFFIILLFYYCNVDSVFKLDGENGGEMFDLSSSHYYHIELGGISYQKSCDCDPINKFISKQIDDFMNYRMIIGV